MLILMEALLVLLKNLRILVIRFLIVVRSMIIPMENKLSIEVKILESATLKILVELRTVVCKSKNMHSKLNNSSNISWLLNPKSRFLNSFHKLEMLTLEQKLLNRRNLRKELLSLLHKKMITQVDLQCNQKWFMLREALTIF